MSLISLIPPIPPLLIHSGLQDSRSQQTYCVSDANCNSSVGYCHYTAFLNHFKTLTLTPLYPTLRPCANILEGGHCFFRLLLSASWKQQKAALGCVRVPLSTSPLKPLQTTLFCLLCSTGSLPFTFQAGSRGLQEYWLHLVQNCPLFIKPLQADGYTASSQDNITLLTLFL